MMQSHRYTLAVAVLVFALFSARANAVITLTPMVSAPVATNCQTCSILSPSSCFRAPAGTPVPVTLVITNTAPTAATPNFFLLSVFPGSVSGFVPPPGASCSNSVVGSLQNFSCVSLPALAAGATYTFSFTFTPPTLPTGFGAFISQPAGDPLPPNNPGNACVSFAPPPVPLLSGMWLAALGIFFAVAALLRLR